MGSLTKNGSQFVIRVPGRINIIGEHIDYNDGIVMPAAINRYLEITASPRIDSLLIAKSKALREDFICDLTRLPDTKPELGWKNYLIGTASFLLERVSVSPRGLTCVIKNNLPINSGLSSSAALELAFALAFIKANDISVTPLELAKLCQKAEKDFVGVQCGLMDQVACLFGKKDQVVYFNARSESIKLIPFPTDYCIAAIWSGEKRELASSEYNLRREECSEALKIIHEHLGLSSFRDIGLDELYHDLRSILPPVLFLRVRHIVEETWRAKMTAKALRQKNMKLVGEYISQSHRSLSLLYRVSTPSIDRQVSVIQSIPGILGARLCGGGFGGYIIALVEKSKMEMVKKGLKQLGRSKDIQGQFFFTHPEEGALHYLG